MISYFFKKDNILINSQGEERECNIKLGCGVRFLKRVVIEERLDCDEGINYVDILCNSVLAEQKAEAIVFVI